MSINITKTGNRLFKETNKGGKTHEIEIFGDEKAFYIKQLADIDGGDSTAGKIIKDERDGKRLNDSHHQECTCHECLPAAQLIDRS